jgi:uncharacterized membrane protein
VKGDYYYYLLGGIAETVGESRFAFGAEGLPAGAAYLKVVANHHSPFGQDRFGRAAEAAARFFGTPQYIVAQTLAVVAWIVLNSVALAHDWDPYPFILLNLVFSTQAAYAAPLILLAQTRQAEREAVLAGKLEQHHQQVLDKSLRRENEIEELTVELRTLLETNTQLTREIRDLIGR